MVNGHEEEKQYEKREKRYMQELYDEAKERSSRINGKVLAEQFCKDHSIQPVKVIILLMYMFKG